MKKISLSKKDYVYMSLLAILLLIVVLSLCLPKKGQSVSNMPISNESISFETISSEFVVELIKIPDIERLDVSTAKTLLAEKGLIPKVEYQYHNDYDYDEVICTYPDIDSKVKKDTSVTIYVCKGPVYYQLSDAVGWISNIEGVEDFVWGPEAADGIGTKSFYTPWVENGYMYIRIKLNCISNYDIEFYEDFGTATINDIFDKAVPIKMIYKSKKVDNEGKTTDFKVKIPLSDLGVQKPTNIYIEFDFLINGQRKDFWARFNLTW